MFVNAAGTLSEGAPCHGKPRLVALYANAYSCLQQLEGEDENVRRGRRVRRADPGGRKHGHALGLLVVDGGASVTDEKRSVVKVYQRLARAFVKEGVTDVFGMVGDGNMHWIEAMSTLGVKIYDARHEGAGLSMADGWARVAKDKGRSVPGVCTATQGPGVAQLSTNMLVAARAQTPLVAFVGEGRDGDDESVQRFDQRRFAEAVEAAFVRVVSAEAADDAVRRAFYLARTESRPVMLSAPVPTQLQDYEEFDDYIGSTELIVDRPIYPHPEAVAAVADLLVESRRPVFVIGRGAMWSGAGDAIKALAERCGAILATTLLAKNWLADDAFHVGVSGLYATRTAIELFAEADCLVSFGASLNRYTTESGYLFPDARIVQVDVRTEATVSGSRSADIYQQSDALLAALAINEALEARGFSQSGYRTPETEARLATAWDDPAEFELEPEVLDPRLVCLALERQLPADVGIVLGNGHQIGFGTMLFRRPRPVMVANQHFGCVGPALSTAIGAVVAAQQPTLLIEGDGGLMTFVGELDTAARYELPLLVVVINDQGLGAEYHKMATHGLNSQLATIRSPDLGALARACGARGSVVTSMEELHTAVEEFLRDPGPSLVDVRVSRSVPSIPYRRMHYGIDA